MEFCAALKALCSSPPLTVTEALAAMAWRFVIVLCDTKEPEQFWRPWERLLSVEIHFTENLLCPRCWVLLNTWLHWILTTALGYSLFFPKENEVQKGQMSAQGCVGTPSSLPLPWPVAGNRVIMKASSNEKVAAVPQSLPLLEGTLCVHREGGLAWGAVDRWILMTSMVRIRFPQ